MTASAPGCGLAGWPVPRPNEPTARPDCETEHQIPDAPHALPGTTALVVTHRPRVMENADTVIRIGDTTPEPLTALEGRSVR
ncbi:hypothetical protein OG453_10735 [Streptomyces sp. NBC_01381]|uniref:hypothetical protein n=1 Tax=Streptomyces sp. NBC_01381 TaxID=2903845 RepID=UPI00224ECFB0|nr:hypothetical protein [Streptomyces sp. NBC_01381]MCX4667132.1 hypothetical protein [Streptomyces sp. NBC_01381]